jgi:hypothetical protein
MAGTAVRASDGGFDRADLAKQNARPRCLLAAGVSRRCPVNKKETTHLEAECFRGYAQA